jgi:hypothetical protein
MSFDASQKPASLQRVEVLTSMPKESIIDLEQQEVFVCAGEVLVLCTILPHTIESVV